MIIKPPAIIAFAGVKRAGKDTAALCVANKKYWMRRGFADKVKQAVALIYGWDLDWMEKNKDSVFDVWPYGLVRQHIIDLAQFMRSKNPDTWIKALERDILAVPCNTVITDLRFPNEVEWIQGMHGKVVFIERATASEALQAGRTQGNKADLDTSEAHHDFIRANADAIIHNNGTIEDLHGAVRALCEEWFEQ